MREFSISIAFLLTCLFCKGQIAFVDVTTAADLEYFGESWGSCWGDPNGDGWPDLFCSNHWRGSRPDTKYPSIYMNNGDGTFREVSLGFFTIDCHAGSWADFDNDGSQELVMGSGPKLPMYIAYSLGIDTFGIFSNKVEDGEIGFSPQQMIFDGDNDGRSDLVALRAKPLAADQSFTSIYRNTGKSLRNVNQFLGFDITGATIMGKLADVDGDRNTELLLAVDKNKVTVFDQQQIPFIPYEIDNEGTIADMVTGDFDGDLLSDILVIYHSWKSYVNNVTHDEISMILQPKTEDHGIDFKATLPLQVELFNGKGAIHDVFVGATPGIADTSYNSTQFSLTLTEFPEGNRAYTAGVDQGFYIGYDSVSMVWSFNFNASVNNNLGLRANLTSLSGDTVELVAVHGFDSVQVLEEDKLLINTTPPSGFGSPTFADHTAIAGVDLRTNSRAGVAGDFDNDMDVDIYLACAGGQPNEPNVILENQGDGTFVKVPFGGGAEGSNMGLTDIATTVDYNNDGFLDIFVTNGATGLSPGPQQLYENAGNANNFLAINLQGTISAIDAAGAVVLLYAGGVAQLREQGSGTQRNGQSHQRLHFGLGANTMVDSIYIHWPSGVVEALYSIAANQFLVVAENPLAVVKPVTNHGASPAMNSGNLVVAPNPARDQVRLDFSGEIPEAAVVEIFSESGRLLIQADYVNGETLSVGSLAPGSYAVVLRDNTGKELAGSILIKAK